MTMNKVQLIGNLGADPEIRHSADGKAIATLRLATSKKWKDKTTGQPVEHTEWHRCKAFGRTAEIAGEYLAKGRQVYVEGELRTEKYTDKDGVERYSTDIIIQDLKLLGSRGGGGDGASVPAPASAPAPASRPQDPDPFGDSDDPLPF